MRLYVSLILISVVICFSQCSSSTSKTTNNKYMTLNDELGYIGDSAAFYMEVLYLEDLENFSSNLYALHLTKEKTQLIAFYKETIAVLEKYNDNDCWLDLQEECEAVVEDLSSGTFYNFSEVFLAWDALKCFYASATDLNILQKRSEYVVLDQKEYSQLTVYSSALINEAKKDEEYDMVYAYKVLGKENGKTKIALYDLEYD